MAGELVGGSRFTHPGRAVPALQALLDPVAGAVELICRPLARLGGVEAARAQGSGLCSMIERNEPIIEHIAPATVPIAPPLAASVTPPAGPQPRIPTPVATSEHPAASSCCADGSSDCGAGESST